MNSTRLFLAVVTLFIVLAGCAKRPEDTAEYKAACIGPPIKSLEEREKIQQEGYLNVQHRCIDKVAFELVQAERARAAQSPNFVAQRAKEQEVARANAPTAPTESASASVTDYVLRYADVNVASEEALAAIPTVGAATARQIVEARTSQPFHDWPDLVSRVIALSQANSAFRASSCGLIVNGQSLPGARPDYANASGVCG
jgi:DNA uptake protein ComE-like DNA-binding protein